MQITTDKHFEQDALSANNQSKNTIPAKTGMVKILFVHHGKGLGGAPLSLLYLIASLDKNRFNPVVVFLYDSEIISLYKSKGISVIGPINLMDFPHTKIWSFSLYHARLLIKSCKDTAVGIFSRIGPLLDAIAPDIIHLNTSSLIAWGIVAKKKKIPVAWHIREPLASGYFGIRKQMIKSIVKHCASAIIPICNNDALPWKNDPKTIVVYNAVDKILFDHKLNPQAFLQQHKLIAKQPTILFVGGMSYEKGTHVILAAFEKLLIKLPQARLLIAGYWDNLENTRISSLLRPSYHYKKQLITTVTQLDSCITLLGPTHNIPQAMAASDVVVFPATTGHFARPVIEAGFMKKAVIASNLAPLNELIIHENTGLLVDCNNIDAWAEKLFLVLTNHAYNKQLGDAAYSFCTQNFDLLKHKNRIECVYNDLINQKVSHESNSFKK